MKKNILKNKEQKERKVTYEGYKTGGIIFLFFLFVFSISFINAEVFGYGATEDLPINYSLIPTVNNSQYLRGLTPQQVANLFDDSHLVPYTGATQNVDLGSYDLTASNGYFSGKGSFGTLTPTGFFNVRAGADNIWFETNPSQAVYYSSQLNSDASNTIRNSPILALRAKYWDGSNNNANIFMQNLITDAATGKYKLSFTDGSTELMSVNNDGDLQVVGNLGVGTDNPDELVHLLKSGDTYLKLETSSASGYNGIKLYNNEGDTNANGRVFIRSGGTAVLAGHLELGTEGNREVRFYTNNLKRGLWNSAGNLLIQQTLDSNAELLVGGDGLIVANDITDAVGSDPSLEFKYGSYTSADGHIARIRGYTQSGGGGDILFETASSGSSSYSTKATLLRNGYFGILETSPQQALHINGNILLENNKEIRTKDNGGTQRTVFELDENNNFNLGSSANGDLNFIGGTGYTIAGYIQNVTGDWYINNELFAKKNIDVGSGTDGLSHDVTITSASNAYSYFKFKGDTGWQFEANPISSNEYDFGMNYNRNVYAGDFYIANNGVRNFVLTPGGNLNVTGNTSFNQNLNINGDLEVNGQSYFYQNMNISQNLTVGNIFAEGYWGGSPIIFLTNSTDGDHQLIVYNPSLLPQARSDIEFDNGNENVTFLIGLRGQNNTARGENGAYIYYDGDQPFIQTINNDKGYIWNINTYENGTHKDVFAVMKLNATSLVLDEAASFSLAGSTINVLNYTSGDRNRLSTIISNDFGTYANYDGQLNLISFNANNNTNSLSAVGATNYLAHGMSLGKFNDNYFQPEVGWLINFGKGSMRILNEQKNEGEDESIYLGFFDDVSRGTDFSVNGTINETHAIRIDKNITTIYNEVNITNDTTIQGNLFFKFGQYIDNLVSGWLRINANVNITNNITANELYGYMGYNSDDYLMISIPAANTWTKITNLTSGLVNGFTFYNDTLVCQINGVYDVSHEESFEDGVGDEYNFAISINNEIINKTKSHSIRNNAGDIAKGSGRWSVYLNVGDNVTLQAINHNTGADVDIHQATVAINRIGN